MVACLHLPVPGKHSPVKKSTPASVPARNPRRTIPDRDVFQHPEYRVEGPAALVVTLAHWAGGAARDVIIGEGTEEARAPSFLAFMLTPPAFGVMQRTAEEALHCL